MSKVISLGAKQHEYDVEKCAGCGKKIKGDYRDISMEFEKKVKHIALCDSCYQISLDHGVIFD